MATTSRIRAFQLLSSRTLEMLCAEASDHRPAPLKRLERLCADLLFERQCHTPASCPVWIRPEGLPY